MEKVLTSILGDRNLDAKKTILAAFAFAAWAIVQIEKIQNGAEKNLIPEKPEQQNSDETILYKEE